MKKKLGLALILVSTATIAAQEISTEKLSDTSVKKYGISLGSSTLKTPDTVKGTDMVYGLSVAGSYEIDLAKNRLSTTTTASLTSANNKNNDNYDTADYTDEYSYETNIYAFTISQSLNKRFDSSFGVVKAKGALGVSQLIINSESKSNYVSHTDSSMNESENSEGEYSAFGKIIELGVELELNNGITPFISYQTANYDPSKAKTTSNLGTYKYKTDAFNLQTTTIGVGYKF